MSKRARSARGEVVDFDLLAIKEQLATTPVPVGVHQRRKFIDEKDGVKTREVVIDPLASPVDEVQAVVPVAEALMVAVQSARESEEAAEAVKFRTKSSKSVVEKE